MKRVIYLIAAVLLFLISTLGADIIARVRIAGEPFGLAINSTLNNMIENPIGALFLFAPFLLVALICAGASAQKAHKYFSIIIFAIAMVVLVYSYFQGYSAAQHAMLEQKWTAAALSIGLLPFFVGIPLLLAIGVAVAVSMLHRKADENK